MATRRVRRAGFTILEILIAIVVLVIGITGIVALFPTAIQSGNQTVEDTYAATLAQSVVDAIAVGLRESRYDWPDPTDPNRIWTYFVFNHDGVLERAPVEPQDFEGGTSGAPDNTPDQVWLRDYCVILPQTGALANTISMAEPTFVYPIPSVEASTEAALQNTQRAPARLSGLNLVDNFNQDDTAGYNFARTTGEGETVPWITRVFHLGRIRDAPGVPAEDVGDLRPEYLGEGAQSGTTAMTGIALDPYPTYSFCFSFKRSRYDSTNDGKISGVPGEADEFTNSLFEVKVMIFKNFDEAAAADLANPEPGSSSGFPPVPKTNVPIQTFVTLISI